MPITDNSKVWRYLSFPKFISLLYKEALWFSVAESFDDPYDGSFLEKDQKKISAIERLVDRLDERDVQYFYNALRELGGDEAVEDHKRWRSIVHSVVNINQKLRAAIGLNCWHRNPGESATMWKLYSDMLDGVVVQSTYGALRKVAEENGLLLKEVKYDDQAIKGFNIADLSLVDHFFIKRRGFRCEREIRLACSLRGPISVNELSGTERVNRFETSLS
jgi:hypothetical protein